ncbi:alpha/beta fold hydrolase [Sphingomonas qomolangmaensis]|uniref:Alpha/beta hydrolase n=1 Tax=Sphingomonas qomolangmaensis TaxID=2918765 RepID=A0ABY5L699_9SPHN|nr:alpha/beta hydrolase [Sphingomonas qomolangmaensis]UUL82302.1 alpha/beta hydrolase [Sphingomonas qomolangmaensis]
MSAAVSVITGAPGLLAAHLVLSQQARGRAVAYRLSAADALRFASLVAGVATDSGGSAVEPEEAGPLAGAEIWHFIAPGEPIERDWLEALRDADVAALNIVETPYCGGGRWRWLLAPQACADAGDPGAAGIGCVRRFRTSLTIGAAPADDIAGDSAQEGVLHFLAVLFDLKTEIEERTGDFFDYHALRCAIDRSAPVAILPVERAATMIASIADKADGGSFTIAAADTMAGEDFLDLVGDAYDLSLLGSPAAGGAEATSLDTLFDLRLMQFGAQLVAPDRAEAERAWALAGIDAADMRFGPSDLTQHIAVARSRQQRADWRTSATPLERRHAERDAQRIAYDRVGDSGPALVFVNALGQGSEAWSRLGRRLAADFRVLGWDLRGLDATDPVMTTADHVADLAAILDAEQVDRAHLVAWCTGPKIAIEFARRFASRTGAMVLLNTTLKGGSTPAALDTAYERNFGSLCDVLARRPAMASSMLASLTANAWGDAEQPIEDAAATVLAMMNADLRDPVLRPFRDEESMLRYAAQLAEFWRLDVRHAAKDIDAPVLLVAAEFDRVASVESSLFAGALFAHSQIVQVPGATHYLLYDRADHIAKLINWFIRSGQSIGLS